jgi:hypothetical protein
MKDISVNKGWVQLKVRLGTWSAATSRSTPKTALANRCLNVEAVSSSSLHRKLSLTFNRTHKGSPDWPNFQSLQSGLKIDARKSNRRVNQEIKSLFSNRKR